MGKNDLPDDWENYSPCGRQIPRTPFVAFKVPLNPNIHGKYSAKYSINPDYQPWGLKDLDSRLPNLSVIIDLTATDRYYNPRSLPRHIKHVKIKTQGHVVPSLQVIEEFKDHVEQALIENPEALIGVHCTHGINRTGYLVCRYLIENLDFDPEEAIEAFGDCRGHAIERRNYISDLQRL